MRRDRVLVLVGSWALSASAVLAADGFTGLGRIQDGTIRSGAYGLTASGGDFLVVGTARSSAGPEAFRWIGTSAGGTMSGIGYLAGPLRSGVALGLSADGLTIVGRGESSGQLPPGSTPFWGVQAFRWTQAGGIVGLGDLVGGRLFSEAFAASTDGSVIVGRSSSANAGRQWEAFRWTGGAMSGLGDLPGGAFHSEARGVAEDGNVVVGLGSEPRGTATILRNGAAGRGTCWSPPGLVERGRFGSACGLPGIVQAPL